MQGFAKKSFIEAHSRSPWTHSIPFALAQKQKTDRSFFCLFALLFEQNKISYLNYILVNRLLGCRAPQDVALFLCHILLATKEGHVCVRISNNKLYPSVEDLWRDGEGNPLLEEERKLVEQQIFLGAESIPSSLVTIMNEKEGQEEKSLSTPICRRKNTFYLQKYWLFETRFLTYFRSYVNSSPTFVLDDERIKRAVDDLCERKVLLKEQGEGVKQSAFHTLTLITGGPGTGKTYTAGYIIKTLWECLTDEQKKTFRIVLAAPTGKAAANLQTSVNRMVGDCAGFPLLQAKTLHALLGIKQGSYKETNRLSADLIVVDESSMIDVKMMGCLFASLKLGSRLILLGDRHQLASVEAGSVFVDLIELSASYSGISSPEPSIPCVCLSVCLRAELKSLIDFASLIHRGLSEEVVQYLRRAKGEGVERFGSSFDKKNGPSEFVSHVLPYFPAVVDVFQKPESILDLFQSSRLLSPMRKGPFGVEALNELIWENISRRQHRLPSSKNFCDDFIAVPIIIITNDYRLELFNGETGVLIRKFPLQHVGSGDYALFPPRDGGGEVRRFSALLLPKYELAYCLSVHKAQGSEFDRVILVLPEGAEIFGREVFYTAVTRAKKSIAIYASDSVLIKTVKGEGARVSGIKERFYNVDSL